MSISLSNEPDSDSTVWEDSQMDGVEPFSESVLTVGGPLSYSQILAFLSSVKGRKKPARVARKYTGNLPGLAKQLKPLTNHSDVPKSMQQRLVKLVKSLQK